MHQIHNGDCLSEMASMESDSVDACFMGPRPCIVTFHHKRREYAGVDMVDGNTPVFRVIEETEQVPARVWPVAMGADELLVEWEDGTLGVAKLRDIRMGVRKNADNCS